MISKILALQSRRSPSWHVIGLTIVTLLLLAFGYGMNVYYIFNTYFTNTLSQMDGSAVGIIGLRLIGLVLYPLGILMGFFNG